jgi:serine/threonine-protein kinase HipA
MTSDMGTPGLPERIKRLDVTLSGTVAGELIRESTYVFRYTRDDEAQPAVSLLLPVNRALHEDGDLFPSMEMNLPEGFLFQQIIEWFRKAQITKMHLLALMGDGGIGRVGFRLPGRAGDPGPDRQEGGHGFS